MPWLTQPGSGFTGVTSSPPWAGELVLHAATNVLTFRVFSDTNEAVAAIPNICVRSPAETH